MAGNQSNNRVKRSETVTEVPPQEYVQPRCEDGLEPEYNDSNQGALGSEPSSKSPAQDRGFPRSQERQESSIARAVPWAVDPHCGKIAVQSPQSPQVPPCIAERTNNPRSDESREQSPTAGLPDSGQPQHPDWNRFPEYSWQESNTAQTWDPSARTFPRVDDQWRARAEVSFLGNHVWAGQPISDQDYGHGALRTVLDPLPRVGGTPPQLQRNILPLPVNRDLYRAQESRFLYTDKNGLPSVAGLVAYPPHNRWSLRPKYAWSGFLPDIYESRRLDWQFLNSRPPPYFQGPTQHLGPPLKPFDGARSEAIALEQWRIAVRERDMNEAEGL